MLLELLGTHRRDGFDELQIAVMHHTAPSSIVTAHLVQVADDKDPFNRPQDAAWYVLARLNYMNTIAHAKSLCLLHESLLTSHH